MTFSFALTFTAFTKDYSFQNGSISLSTCLTFDLIISPLTSLTLNRFVSLDDYAWFDKTLLRVMEEEFNEEHYTNILKPAVFFGDFMR